MYLTRGFQKIINDSWKRRENIFIPPGKIMLSNVINFARALSQIVQTTLNIFPCAITGTALEFSIHSLTALQIHSIFFY